MSFFIVPLYVVYKYVLSLLLFLSNMWVLLFHILNIIVIIIVKFPVCLLQNKNRIRT